MSFLWPWALAALLVVPLAAAAWWWVERRPSRYAVAFSNLGVLESVVDRSGAWRRWLPPALFLAALASLAFALARPQADVMVDREQATIVLAIDTSGSMLADDVEPTRLEAAQKAVAQFLEGLPPKFRVGLVAFAGDAQVVAPVSRDRELVRQALSYLTPQRGTAIGDSVARAAELAREAVGPQPERRLAAFGAATTQLAQDGEQEPAAVLFLSDGFQTVGDLQPLDGAARARELGIPVFTIALGTQSGVLDLGFGRQIPVPARPRDPAGDRAADRRQVLRRADGRGPAGRLRRPRLPARRGARRDRGHVGLRHRGGAAGAARRRAVRALVQPDSVGRTAGVSPRDTETCRRGSFGWGQTRPHRSPFAWEAPARGRQARVSPRGTQA